jgi:hypothetical protein
MSTLFYCRSYASLGIFFWSKVIFLHLVDLLSNFPLSLEYPFKAVLFTLYIVAINFTVPSMGNERIRRRVSHTDMLNRTGFLSRRMLYTNLLHTCTELVHTCTEFVHMLDSVIWSVESEEGIFEMGTSLQWFCWGHQMIASLEDIVGIALVNLDRPGEVCRE